MTTDVHELAFARSAHGDRWRIVIGPDLGPVTLQCSTSMVNGVEQWTRVDTLTGAYAEFGVTFQDGGKTLTVNGNKAHMRLIDELRKRSVLTEYGPEAFHKFKFNYLDADKLNEPPDPLEKVISGQWNRDLEAAFAHKAKVDFNPVNDKPMFAIGVDGPVGFARARAEAGVKAGRLATDANVDLDKPGHRRVNLLSYVEELERTAGDADDVGWRRAGPHDEDCGSDGLVRAVDNPSPYRRLVGESMSGAVQEHVLATQPIATMAITAKLREAFYLMQEAGWLVSLFQPEYPLRDQTRRVEADARVLGRVAALAKRLVLFPSIQVPDLAEKKEPAKERKPLTREQAHEIWTNARRRLGQTHEPGGHFVTSVIDAIIEASK